MVNFFLLFSFSESFLSLLFSGQSFRVPTVTFVSSDKNRENNFASYFLALAHHQALVRGPFQRLLICTHIKLDRTFAINLGFASETENLPHID